MKVAVWDTYVKRSDGKKIHFDILVRSTLKDEAVIYEYGKTILNLKTSNQQSYAAKNANFVTLKKQHQLWFHISRQGFHIDEMENCN